MIFSRTTYNNNNIYIFFFKFYKRTAALQQQRFAGTSYPVRNAHCDIIISTILSGHTRYKCAAGAHISMDTLCARGAAPWNAFTAKTIVVSTPEVVELITGASGNYHSMNRSPRDRSSRWYAYIYIEKEGKKPEETTRRREIEKKNKIEQPLFCLSPARPNPTPLPPTVFFDLRAERLISTTAVAVGKRNGQKKIYIESVSASNHNDAHL